MNETNEELQALVLTRGVEEGINLLNGTSNSLAQELHDMSQTQVRKRDLITIESLIIVQISWGSWGNNNSSLN